MSDNTFVWVKQLSSCHFWVLISAYPLQKEDFLKKKPPPYASGLMLKVEQCVFAETKTEQQWG